jgi:hypothetical protein
LIVVCVPWVKVDPAKKFLPQWMEWYAFNKEKHDLRQNFQMYRPLYEVQEETVEMAKRQGASHVLFVEDDHWGFPIDGLDVLLEADEEVIGFQTFRKKYPYASLAMKKDNPEHNMIGRREDLEAMGLALRPHEQGDGPEVQETDMITWAFTLVKMSVFEKLHIAGKFPFQQQGPVPTDSYFNQYCDDIGIKRHVHFGFGIAHGEHDPADLPTLRRIETAHRQAKQNSKILDAWVPTEYTQEEIQAKVEDFNSRNGVAA